MIKTIFDKEFKRYRFEYYCDRCFKQLNNGDILRNEKAIRFYKFDLCGDCNKKGEEDND